MKHAPALSIRAKRVAPMTGLDPTELGVLAEVSEYLNDREITGSTLLDAATVGRQAYLWTLSNGEHVLLLMQAQRFCYWLASSEPLKQLHERASDWLTEPSVEASLRQTRTTKR